MVIGRALSFTAVICRNPNFISHFLLPAHPPACQSGRRRLYLPFSLDAHLKNVSVRTWGFKFREEADGEGYVRDGTFSGSRTREKRTWWTDGSTEEDFDDEDYDFDDEKPESLWDKVWIFKVFKAYGYFLPAIIASMLLATGPKAFLMALALPLGQSALSLVFEKVLGQENGSSAKRRSRAKRWASGRSRYSSRSKAAQEEEEGIPDAGYGNDYRSWVVAEADASVAGQNGARKQPVRGGYGGWDELDKHQFRKAKMPSTASAGRAQSAMKEKLTRRGRSKEMPFFWRMFVAVFPFLGSLTKYLW